MTMWLFTYIRLEMVEMVPDIFSDGTKLGTGD